MSRTATRDPKLRTYGNDAVDAMPGVLQLPQICETIRISIVCNTCDSRANAHSQSRSGIMLLVHHWALVIKIGRRSALPKASVDVNARLDGYGGNALFLAVEQCIAFFENCSRVPLAILAAIFEPSQCMVFYLSLFGLWRVWKKSLGFGEWTTNCAGKPSNGALAGGRGAGRHRGVMSRICNAGKRGELV
eukprot:4172277-Amphidinium_carterae.1